MPDARQGWRVGDSRVIAAGGWEAASEGGWVGGGKGGGGEFGGGRSHTLGEFLCQRRLIEEGKWRQRCEK